MDFAGDAAAGTGLPRAPAAFLASRSRFHASSFSRFNRNFSSSAAPCTGVPGFDAEDSARCDGEAEEGVAGVVAATGRNAFFEGLLTGVGRVGVSARRSAGVDERGRE